MALVLITHDLALVAEAAHKIIVMYAGQVVETGAAQDIFRAPRHPPSTATRVTRVCSGQSASGVAAGRGAGEI